MYVSFPSFNASIFIQSPYYKHNDAYSRIPHIVHVCSSDATLANFILSLPPTLLYHTLFTITYRIMHNAPPYLKL